MLQKGADTSQMQVSPTQSCRNKAEASQSTVVQRLKKAAHKDI